MTELEILRSMIVTEQDVFAVRRQGRQIAASLGLEGQDQIRVATALSEVGRRLLSAVGIATVTFVVSVPDDSGAASRGTHDHARATWLSIRMSVRGRADDDVADGLAVTKVLMDEWAVHRDAAGTVVTMARQLPRAAAGLTPAEIQAIRADVVQLTAGTALEELAENNRQLLATLAEVQAHRDELLRLNAELEATNQGVLALYTELSGELESTNRGVVALYAELDERASQVRMASEAKTRFLANVSHELRAPVTSIGGLTRLLRDPASDPITAEQAHQLEMVDTSAHSLLTLVNDLLDLAKAESGRLDPARETIDVGAIFDTLRGTLRAWAPSAETTLVVENPVGLPSLRSDPVMLTQILRNLLTNALKFTPDGEVRMTAVMEPDGMLALTVSDTGIGIPVDEQERVFEEFHQVRSPLQARLTGTGLGLPYARRLVAILGGSIDLSSVPGEGSTFTVRLPVGDVTEPPVGETPISVLVVDDDEGFRTAASGVLRGCGFTVYEAADGRTALAAARARPPDMMLLDLRLAELDGFAVLDVLGAEPELQGIPVVVVTAYPEDLINHPAAERTVAVLDKTRTTLDDLCIIVRSTVRPASQHT
ncbi:MAG TPA: ATP-binding protein [Micromonosporaceae bacterium]|jgi:signal transduction histidine kinase